jgi:hypothetical protein
MKQPWYSAIVACIGLSLMVLGCENSGKDPYVEEVVLQGSMYVGHPLAVRITHTIPIQQAYDSREVGVSGASVQITANGRLFNLIEQPSDTGGAGYFSLPADSHVVTPGVQYAIQVNALGRVLTAQMIAAGPIHITGQNHDSVTYKTVNGEFSFTWTPDSLCAGYDAIIEMTDADWNADYRLLTGRNGDRGGGNERIARIGRDEDSLRIPWDGFDRWGDYRVRILSSDVAAWNYLWAYRPGEANIQLVSNVQGGLGLFCAGGADTAYFYVKDNPNAGSGG